MLEQIIASLKEVHPAYLALVAVATVAFCVVTPMLVKHFVKSLKTPADGQ